MAVEEPEKEVETHGIDEAGEPVGTVETTPDFVDPDEDDGA